MSREEIDAGAVLDERERERANVGDATAGTEVEGARGEATLQGARRLWPRGGRTFLVVLGVVIAAIATALLLKARTVRQENETRKREPQATERVEKRAPPLKLVAPPVVAPAQPLEAKFPLAGEPAELAPAGAPQAPSEAQVVEQRRLSRGFGSVEGENSGGEAARQSRSGVREGATGQGTAAIVAPGGDVRSKAAVRGSLEERLDAVELRAASAGVLPDRDYLLTQGSMLDCALETRVVSTQAGMVSCHLTRDVYSTNGRVVLLDRGSKVLGRYQGGAQQGEARIFVLWTRVETPSGVVVDLQSPGTGPLGEAGLGGWVDTHFWDRFGAAILLSLIQDGGAAAAARVAGPSQSPTISVTNQAAVTQAVATKSLDPTVNIPPTLYKNQGERVGIFVARDLDFRSVYGLERVSRARQ